MKLPPGGSQGEPRTAGGYKRTAKGEFFFEKADYDDPSGEVMEFPLEAASLTAFVDNMLGQTEKLESLQVGLAGALDKMTDGAVTEQLGDAERAIRTRVTSKQPCTISGLEAIEVVTDAPRTTLALYIRKESKVIAVTFGAPRQDFPKYENLFRDTIRTITIR